MTFIQNRRFYGHLFWLGIVILAGIIVAAANWGATRISWQEGLIIILSRIPLLKQLIATDSIDPAAFTIICNLRLPRILLAALLGAGLAVTGTAFQGIFKNPMADPFVLGISAGSALGASLAMVLGINATFFGFGLITVAAFGGGIVTVLLVYNIARVGNKVANITLLLSGIAMNLFLTAILSLLMTFRREQMERIVMWTMGSVATADWREVGLLFPVVLGAIVVIFVYARDLNCLLTGDDSARSLGIAVEQVKKTVLIIGTLMVGALVAVSGIVGFVGLIVPHMIRSVFGADHRVVIPFAAIWGAILLIICDLLARSLTPPSEIPLGIVTALLGVPFFLYLIVGTKKKVF